ncbi:unnamed protein product [Triticum turgidum subsp. durum]|uniref:Uncharacterized protein n=1 Tax=Triticum turgidum subsp. durum TaxID=4567 RepID=A0A9R0RJ04_TRITD|nr:unnamed protein product [Triticum turgidum subsp. durum]
MDRSFMPKVQSPQAVPTRAAPWVDASPPNEDGEIIFVSGVSLAIGLKSTVQFFTKPKNRKCSIAFRVVLFLVLIGWPVFSMMAESYGFALLFSVH